MGATVSVGEIVAGKYRIDAVLGEGGMGVVVAAHHLQLDEKVAIKFLLPEALKVPEVVARFAREARTVAKIKSEHVVRVIDVGTLEGGAPFMVMEFLHGQDLAQILRQDGPMPVSVAAHHVIEACEALAEAHALGIVHRDVKPANLFLARLPGGETIVKVLDFGISKLAEPVSDLSLTKTQSMLGTPLYMSVEQMTASKDTDARADIWSLGVVLYELVTGRVPFSGENAHAVLAAMLQTTPTRPSEIRPEIPAAFDAIVKRCLNVDAKKRYLNVAELVRALTRFSAGEDRVERISRVLGVTVDAESATPPREAISELPASPASTEIPRERVVAMGPPGASPTTIQTQGAWDAPPVALPVSRSIWAVSAIGVFLVFGVAAAIALSSSATPTSGAGIVMTPASEVTNGSASLALPSASPIELASTPTVPLRTDRARTAPSTGAAAPVARPKASASASASASAAVSVSVSVPTSALARPPAPPPEQHPHADNPLDMQPK